MMQLVQVGYVAENAVEATRLLSWGVFPKFGHSWDDVGDQGVDHVLAEVEVE